MKKQIKIKFIGFWTGFDPNELIIYNLMKKNYDILICDNPDYIICGPYGTPYEFCRYSQVRIMMVEENFIPDFNLIDYAICGYPITFQDRCFFKPVCFEPWGRALELEKKPRQFNSKFLGTKTRFANFIASHESEFNIRGDFFKKLSQYKRVDSVGSYLNNMPKRYTVDKNDDSKVNFQKQCKFSLCFESTKHEGFVTEKITDAFFADTIPIYYGSSTVKEIFNPKAFIDVSDFNSFEDAVEYIKKIDQDDELYLSIMNQPVLNENKYFSNIYNCLEKFLLNIFEQPLDKAYRRSRVYFAKKYENYILQAKKSNYNEISSSRLAKIIIDRLLVKAKLKKINKINYFPGRDQ